MTAFIWVDRDGQRHELDSPAPIESEATAIARDMDGVVTMFDDPDPMIRDAARAAIGKLQPKLEQLSKDLVRWNVHAVTVTRAAAAKLAGQIEQLPAMIVDVMLVVAVHGEHDRIAAATAGTPDLREKIFAAPSTALQRQAISACKSRSAPADTATRGKAKEWLDAQPRFARGGQVDGGWFGWIDRQGHAHRLTDPLMIESEIATVARELAELRPALTDASDPEALYAAVNKGVASWDRLRILQSDLERFDDEAAAREDKAWTAYAADWRSKRTE